MMYHFDKIENIETSYTYLYTKQLLKINKNK